MPAPTFRLLVVPGVTVDRWARTWAERRPDVEFQVVPAEAGRAAALLAEREAEAGLVRLPVDQDTFHAIPLYTEVTVAVVPKDHVLTAGDELTLADLADEAFVRPLDDVLDWPGAEVPPDRPDTTAAAVEWVASGVGILVTPMSLARAYHRRDLTYRVVSDAPTSSVGLAWPKDGYSDLVEEMIGIVRGRTANSTRGQATPQPARGPDRRDGRSGQRRDTSQRPRRR